MSEHDVCCVSSIRVLSLSEKNKCRTSGSGYTFSGRIFDTYFVRGKLQTWRQSRKSPMIGHAVFARGIRNFTRKDSGSIPLNQVADVIDAMAATKIFNPPRPASLSRELTTFENSGAGGGGGGGGR